MVENNIRIEGASIKYKNFAGKEGDFNPKGKRNFCVLLDHQIAQELKDEGWNIRYLKPIDIEDEPQPYLQVAVAFGKIPPKIVMINSKGKTKLDESTINCLDWAEFKNVDLVIRPYNWEVRGQTGVKAYLKTMYVVIKEDEFESKYYDVPDSAMSAIME